MLDILDLIERQGNKSEIWERRSQLDEAKYNPATVAEGEFALKTWRELWTQ